MAPAARVSPPASHQVAAVADSLEFENKYTSGVIT